MCAEFADEFTHSSASNSRWMRAQESEKRYWESGKSEKSEKRYWNAETMCTTDRRKYWNGMLKYGFNLDYDFLFNKDVLEIGCGSTGIIFQLQEAKSRVGIDPIDLDLVETEWKRQILSRGVGERLPFHNDSFDAVISFNSLDHVIDPDSVIKEVYRVLRANGDFLLWLHSLRNCYNILKRPLNKLDSPHPYHFTIDEIIAKLTNYSFQIKYKKCQPGTGLSNDTIKRIWGNIFMNTTWIWSKKLC